MNRKPSSGTTAQKVFSVVPVIRLTRRSIVNGLVALVLTSFRQFPLFHTLCSSLKTDVTEGVCFYISSVQLTLLSLMSFPLPLKPYSDEDLQGKADDLSKQVLK